MLKQIVLSTTVTSSGTTFDKDDIANISQSDVLTIVVTGGTGAQIEATHADQSTDIEVSADSSSETVPGVVNLYGFGWSAITVTALTTNVEVSIGVGQSNR